jgi:Zn-dependent peptidase ImmA (M78 family)
MKKIIEKHVNELLEINRIIEPPINVEMIASNLSITVTKHPYDSKENLSGMLIRDGDNVIIGVNESNSTERQRFSIAHEIGHYLLHEGKLIVDRDIKYQVNYRNSKSSLGIDSEEIEANQFASALLMPDKFIIEDLKEYEFDIDDSNIEDVSRELADKYGVSFTAMLLKISSKLH